MNLHLLGGAGLSIIIPAEAAQATAMWGYCEQPADEVHTLFNCFHHNACVGRCVLAIALSARSQTFAARASSVTQQTSTCVLLASVKIISV